MLSFQPQDGEQMRAIEARVSDVIRPLNQTTEAAIVVFALLRIARTLLRLYPGPTRDQLTRVCVDFLEGREVPRDAAASSLILQ